MSFASLSLSYHHCSVFNWIVSLNCLLFPGTNIGSAYLYVAFCMYIYITGHLKVLSDNEIMVQEKLIEEII